MIDPDVFKNVAQNRQICECDEELARLRHLPQDEERLLAMSLVLRKKGDAHAELRQLTQVGAWVPHVSGRGSSPVMHIVYGYVMAVRLSRMLSPYTHLDLPLVARQQPQQALSKA